MQNSRIKSLTIGSTLIALSAVAAAARTADRSPQQCARPKQEGREDRGRMACHLNEGAVSSDAAEGDGVRVYGSLLAHKGRRHLSMRLLRPTAL